MRHIAIICVTTLLFSAHFVSALSAQTDDNDAIDRVNAATRRLAQKQKYVLQYKFRKDDQLRWNVEHTASTKTQIAGTLEETSSRSQSTKLWNVLNVDSQGNMRFIHSIESVEMWQKIGDGLPVTYNSRTDTDPPAEFTGIEAKIGKPLAMITISPSGEIVDRKSSMKQARFGVGEICIPLPKQSISIGFQWHVPTTFRATDEDGRVHQLKARLKYELTKVKDKFAYISFKTEVLTPIQSQKVRSQILQQLTDGYVVFDIPNGRIIRKEVEWNETVQGYEGPDSFLQYNGRLTEKFVKSEPNSQTPAAATSQNVIIKKRDGKPMLRK